MLENTKKILSVIPVALIAVGVVTGLLMYLQYSSQHRQERYAQHTIQGTAMEVTSTSGSLVIEDDGGRRFLISLVPETKVLDEDGNSATLSYIKAGFVVSITGTIRDQALVPAEIRVISR